MQLTELFIRERRYFKNVSPATVEWYEQSFRAFSGAWETKQALGQRIADLLTAGIQPVSVNTYLRCIRAFLRWAYAEGHLSAIFPVPKLKHEEKVIATLRPDQIQRILRARPKNTTERRLHTLALTLMDTGMRIAEALRLEQGDLDFDSLLIRVCGKGGKQRLVPMSLELRKVLFRFVGARRSGPVFATRSGTRLGQRNTLRDFKAFGERIGAITDVRFSFHTLRHTFALNYIRSGGDVFRLQRILGHSTLEMTRRYVNLQTEDLQAVHDRLSLLTRHPG